jgi:hypothetical protein
MLRPVEFLWSIGNEGLLLGIGEGRRVARTTAC